MSGTRKRLAWLPAAAMTLILCAGCAHRSQPPCPPMVAPPITLTPLPESVKNIPPTISPGYLQRVSNWLQKVDDWSSSATPK